MFHSRCSLLSMIWVAFLAAGLSTGVACAADSDCQPEFEALSKLATTPTHSYTTQTAASRAGGKPVNSEAIYAGGVIYFKVNGKWIRSTLTPQQELQQVRENQKNSKATCRYLREELVNGEVASVYSTHGENEDAKSDARIWISKSRGLLLRQEVELNVGGTLGKSSSSTRYEYGNVEPPR